MARPDHEALGGLLRRLRGEAGLTQEKLAEAAGLSARAVSDLERGVNQTARPGTARLLAKALGLAGPARAAFEAAAVGRAKPGSTLGQAAQTLPRDIASFTGRTAELAALTDIVTAAAGQGGIISVCAVGGMAGIGKTALAVHAAHQLASRFPDGQLFVPLHGHTPGMRPADPAAALADLLMATGATPGQIPDGLDARAAAWRNRMTGRELLLVLDDATGSDQVTPLLPGAPGCLTIVTSRRHLTALDDAATISLDTLPLAETALLITRLAGRPGLNPASSAITRIAEMCGNLPLAASILARQLRHHPSWEPADLAAELTAARDRLELMDAEDQTVAAAFSLSYADLTAGEQRLFRLLGLHPGDDTDAYAAAALADLSLAEAQRDLRGLYDQHLIAEPACGRYRFHDLIRQHARALAERDPAADRDTALGRLLGFYQCTAAGAEALLTRRTRPSLPPASPPDVRAAPAMEDADQALAWARTERASLLACLDHVTGAGQHDRVIALTAGLTTLMHRDGPWADAVTRHATAIQAARCVGDPVGEAGALHALGSARNLTGDFPGAGRAYEDALDLYRDLGSRLGEGSILYELGWVRMVSGDYPAAAWALEQALGIYRDLGSRLGEARALYRLGGVRWLTGDAAASAQAHQQALRIHEELGGPLGEGRALRHLGAMRLGTGDYAGAAQTFRQSLDTGSGPGDGLSKANALWGLGSALRRIGDYAAAVRAFEQALATFDEIGSQMGKANALSDLGSVLWRTGDCQAAVRTIEHSLSVSRAVMPLAEAGALMCLGALRRATGDYADAARTLHRALRTFHAAGDQPGQVEALNETGTLHRSTGDFAQAEECHRQALELARSTGNSWDEAAALTGLSCCARAAGDAAGAVTQLRQARQLFRRSGVADVDAMLTEHGATAG